MLEHLPPEVTVFEVGPRDGLQNEANFVVTSGKVRLIEVLAEAGLTKIEITSFVSPKWIPQLADGLQVATTVKLPPQVTTSALVPNLKGYELARKAGLRAIALFMSATETHSKKNINKTITQAMVTLKEVAQLARQDGVKVRGYLSVVFGCPYEGQVNADHVAKIVSSLLEIGIDELSLGDTIGAATPLNVIKLVKLLSTTLALNKMALHFHDTRGTALANVLAGLDAGVTTFDASVGGMGGCPYAPGAAGNLATEDLVYLLESLGIKTGVDLDKLVTCGQIAQEILGKQLPGKYLQAALAQRSGPTAKPRRETNV
ncbi:MAG: hydroxymethylglutaryl-CoA lyase [Candidatus Melainabacteria bacterium]|nr:hydroxymethylglutaryl-CoA lyase [Candidatus Melainabacteria bacterium]